MSQNDDKLSHDNGNKSSFQSTQNKEATPSELS